MGSETTTTVEDASPELKETAQSDQNDAEKSISTVSQEKVNDRDTLPNDNGPVPKRYWSDYIPKDAYKVPDSLEGRLSYYIENLNDWLKMKEKLRLKSLFGNLHKSYSSAYVSRWLAESNALLRTINRIHKRKIELKK